MANKQSFKFEEKKAREYLRDYLRVIKECNSLKDSFAIIYYMLTTPKRIIQRLIGIYPEPKLLYDVTIKNEDEIFFCGKSWLKTQGAITDYEPETRRYFNLDKGVFIDIGANIGKYSVMLGRKYPSMKIVSIEASKETFEILKKNIKLNNLKNVIPLNIAASNKKGVSYFYLSNKGLGTSCSLKEIKEHSKKIKVKTDTIDNIIDNIIKIKKIRLIKIDVEGSEPEVLKGAIRTLRRDKPRVIFEALNKENFEKSSKILIGLGYKIKRVGRIDFIADYKL